MSTKAKRSAALAKGSKPLFAVRLDADLIAYLRALAEREHRPVAMQLALILEEHRRRQKE